MRILATARLALAAAFVVVLSASASMGTEPKPLSPVTASDSQGRLLIDRLRQGGLVMFFRHADTIGMPCDRSFRVDDREGQRNISPRGQEQSRRIGEAFIEHNIPLSYPVLAGPVFRVLDTAELAFGADKIEVTDSLLADDFSGTRLEWVLAEHQRLFGERVPARTNRILVGHRTPAIMVLGPSVGQRAFPEGAALVLEPKGTSADVLGILMLAPIAGGGFHTC